MSDLRTAAQQALEALENVDGSITALLGGLLGNPDADAPGAKVRTAITALKAALAQRAEPNPMSPEQRQRWEELAAMPQQAEPVEPVEPVAWKQGNLVTFNEDPYPALGSLFVQFWDSEEVAARVYANDHETLRQRCAKLYTAPPQRNPLTEEEIDALIHPVVMADLSDEMTDYEIARAVERAHGIKGELK